MRRKQFFTTLGITAGTVFFAPYLVSCSKEDGPADSGNGGTSGGTVDFTIDLTLPVNSALNANGGSLLKNGVIVARTSAGSYIAVASVCTHEGFTLAYDNTGNQFHCANHGSNFNTTGAVINGPATSALKRYNTQLSGTSLRVFA